MHTRDGRTAACGRRRSWARMISFLRGLAAPSRGFDVDFTSRERAVEIFEEGVGPLLTDGIHACMDPGHIAYNVPLDDGEHGMRITMDGARCNGAQVAVGRAAQVVIERMAAGLKVRALQDCHGCPEGRAAQGPFHRCRAWCPPRS